MFIIPARPWVHRSGMGDAGLCVLCRRGAPGSRSAATARARGEDGHEAGGGDGTLFHFHSWVAAAHYTEAEALA